MCLEMKTIVFDMDETLIHCKDNLQEMKEKNFIHDKELKFKVTDNVEITAYMKFRPYLHRMLKKLSQHFELILYSSGEQPYAEAALEHIEQRKFRFF